MWQHPKIIRWSELAALMLAVSGSSVRAQPVGSRPEAGKPAPASPPAAKSARPAPEPKRPARKTPPAAAKEQKPSTRDDRPRTAVEKPCRCPKKKCPTRKKRRIVLGAAVSIGGFYSKTTRWIRSDANLRIELGIWVHRQVQVQVALINSLERYMHLFRVGALWFPWNKGPYGRFSFELGLTGAGPQPGLSGAVGFAWWFSFPLGLYAEFEPSGYLTEPYVFQLQVAGGVFTYF